MKTSFGVGNGLGNASLVGITDQRPEGHEGADRVASWMKISRQPPALQNSRTAVNPGGGNTLVFSVGFCWLPS